MKPIARWMAVVFPAPLGPRNPNISPLWTWSEKLSSAAIRAPVKRLYSLLMFSNSRAKGIQEHSILRRENEFSATKIPSELQNS